MKFTAMQQLVEMGLMRSLGRVSWCPDEFFTITEEGRRALRRSPDGGAA